MPKACCDWTPVACPANRDPAEGLHLFRQIAGWLPGGTGHAGHSLIHPMTFMPQSGDEIARLVRRPVGFDLRHDFVALAMRGRVLTAPWLNWLDGPRAAALGGAPAVANALSHPEVSVPGDGLLIRSARHPAVRDLNRQAPDVGQLPEVARVLAPLRLTNGLLVGMGGLDSSRAWLERLDGLASRPWENG